MWKQRHHHTCAEALDARFGLGATTQQVDRYFRAFKEKWNWIKVAMDKSGYGFDAGSCNSLLREITFQAWGKCIRCIHVRLFFHIICVDSNITGLTC